MVRRILTILLLLHSSVSWSEDILVGYETTITPEQTFRPRIPATGRLQLFTVSNRFAWVFDEQGRAVMALDLAMEDIGFGKMVLGSFGIGGMSIRDLFGRYRKFRDRPEDVLEQNGVDDEFDKEFKNVLEDLESRLGSKTDLDLDDTARGYKAFAELAFKDEWINRQRGPHIMGVSSGFLPASFTLADLKIGYDRRQKLYPIMREFSKLIFDQDLLNTDLEDFLTQFQMIWDQKKQSFSVSLVPDARFANSKKRPDKPGAILDYAHPYDMVRYKTRLQRIETLMMVGESVLGLYGRIFGIFVSRVGNGVRLRMESHENQLLTVLEAVQKGQMKLDMPVTDMKAFVDDSILMLYLNKTISTKDLADAVAKREKQLKAEKENADENLKWLEKRYNVSVWPDGRFATVFKKGDSGKRLGVVSLAIKRKWLAHTPSFHFLDGWASYKTQYRVSLEIFTDAVRLYLPAFFSLTDWIYNLTDAYIGFSLYLPANIWDSLFRGRTFTEIAYEGLMIGQLNEAMIGTLAVPPGYTREELPRLKKWLYLQRQNPYEIKAEKEYEAIKFHLKALKEIVEKNEEDRGPQ